MSKNKLYMKVTNDEYELPLAVADSIADLARMTGVKPESLYSIISEDRSTGCHSHCELYKQFQEASEKNKEEYHKSLIWDKYHEAQVKKLKGKR